MNAFTDDDLEAFKELDSIASIHDKYGNEEIRKRIPSLLARLEAAEAVASYTEKYAPRVAELQNLIKAWKESGR